jgi:hypothetical protein
LSVPTQDIFSQTEKQQGAAALRNDAILIFKLANFCFSKSESRTWVLYKGPQAESLLPTQDTYKQTEKTARRCNFQG